VRVSQEIKTEPDVKFCEGVVLIQIDENSATLTPFGSLIRTAPARSAGAKSWTAKLRAMLAFLFR
jgi:hypothetical protein